MTHIQYIQFLQLLFLGLGGIFLYIVLKRLEEKNVVGIYSKEDYIHTEFDKYNTHNPDCYRPPIRLASKLLNKH